jgi:hypothetical protein
LMISEFFWEAFQSIYLLLCKICELKRTNNNLQNTTQKTKDWAPQTPLKLSSSCSTSGMCRIIVTRYEQVNFGPQNNM